MAAAMPAYAQELTLGVDQSMEATSNAFRTEDDPQADGFYRVALVGVAKEESNRLNYDIRYVPSYRAYFVSEGLNGWDHNLTSSATFMFSPRGSLSGTLSYQNYQAIRADTVEDPNNPGVSEVVRDNDARTQRINASLFYDWSIATRLAFRLTGSYEDWSSTSERDVGNRAVTGDMQFRYAVLQRLNVGIGMLGRYRAFEEQNSLPASSTITINPNLLLSVDVTDTISLVLNGGPSALVSQQKRPTTLTVSRWLPAVDPAGNLYGRPWTATSPTDCQNSATTPFTALALCPFNGVTSNGALANRFDETVTLGFLPGQSFGGDRNTETTYFIYTSLTKSWARSSASVSYQRTEDAGGGRGQSTVYDVVTARARWNASEYWDILVTASWTRREGTAEQEQAIASAQLNTDGVVDDLGNPLAEAAGLWISPFRNELSVTQYQAVARATRRLTRKMSISGEFRYYNQSDNSLFGSGAGAFDIFNGLVTFRYEFDSFRF